MFKRLILGLTLAAAPAIAIDISKLKPQGYVSDFAGVVDARGKAELERYATLVKERTGAELAFVTLSTLDDEPIEDIANRLFIQWGVGVKGKDEGLLLLLAINDRRSRLEIGYGLEPILPDGLSGEVLRNMRPSLRAGDYGDALIAAASSMGGRIAQAKGVTLDGSPQPRVRRDAEGEVPVFLIIVSVFILLMVLNSIFGGGRRGGGPRMGGGGPIIWYGGGSRSPGWPRSGGGFGGFDSGGGGFGGFGGGSSGGGGASSDW